MSQAQFNGPKTSHGNAHNGAIRPAFKHRKLALCVRDEVTHDVVLVFVLRSLSRIRKVRRITFWHDQYQSLFGEMCDVRIIGPVAKASSPAMKQIHDRKLFAIGDICRQHNAVLHVAIESSAVESHIAQRHFRSKPR